MAGPPPKPPERRQRRNPRTSSARATVVVLPSQGLEPPPPPPGLLAVTKRRWEDFWTSKVADAVDRRSDLPALVRWARAVDEYDRVAKVVKRARLVKGSMGQPVANPLLGYLGQLDATIARLEGQFGMTPMSRLRLGVALGEAARSLEELNAAFDDDPDSNAGEAVDPRVGYLEPPAAPAGR